MDRPPVDPEDRKTLLLLARRAIVGAVLGGEPVRVDERELSDDLRAPRGAFVTLTEGGDLRGCIGRLDFETALWANVIEAAISSALDDPRFPPVAPSELPILRVEVSVLERPVDIASPEGFDVRVHGIIVSRGFRRGLLLPQVAEEQGWDARTTLEAACRKAGLAANAWLDPDTHLQVFTAFHFSEEAGPSAV